MKIEKKARICNCFTRNRYSKKKKSPLNFDKRFAIE